MIEVKNIFLTLNKRQILNNVSLTLKEGNIYGLVGNNGSGKTMLMKCMCGFIRPTEGTVESNGNVIGRDVDYLPDAGVIIENPSILILDEPMNGLDKNGVEEIRKLLLSMKDERKIIVIASHNAEDIRVLCDEVHEMERGELL